MDKPEIPRQAIRARVERLFEPSRMEDELLAVAYETVVPIRRAALPREMVPQRPKTAAAGFSGDEILALEFQG